MTISRLTLGVERHPSWTGNGTGLEPFQLSGAARTLSLAVSRKSGRGTRATNP
jgi:hypothetical protein